MYWTDNPMVPYAADLSNWDPSCGFDFFRGSVTDEQFRWLAIAIHDLCGVEVNPELGPQKAAEEALINAQFAARKRAFDAYIEAHPLDENDPRFSHLEADRTEAAVNAEAEAEEKVLEAFRLLVVNLFKQGYEPP